MHFIILRAAGATFEYRIIFSDWQAVCVTIVTSKSNADSKVALAARIIIKFTQWSLFMAKVRENGHFQATSFVK